jgi:hypothetical protein
MGLGTNLVSWGTRPLHRTTLPVPAILLVVLFAPSASQAKHLDLVWRLVIEGKTATVTTNAFRNAPGNTFPFPIVPVHRNEFSFQNSPNPERDGIVGYADSNGVALLTVHEDGSLDSEALIFLDRRFLVDTRSGSVFTCTSWDSVPQIYRNLLAEARGNGCNDPNSLRAWRYEPLLRLGVLIMEHETIYDSPFGSSIRRPYCTGPILFNNGNAICVEQVYGDDHDLIVARLANLDYRGGYGAKGEWSRFFTNWVARGPGFTILASVYIPQKDAADIPAVLCADQSIEIQKTLTPEQGQHIRYFGVGGTNLLVANEDSGSAFVYELTSDCDAKRVAFFSDPHYWIVGGAISSDGGLIALDQQVPNQSDVLVTVLDDRLHVLDQIHSDQDWTLSFSGEYLVLGMNPGPMDFFFSTREIRIYRLTD